MPVTYALLSRRSRFRAGVRYERRGADATGAVANFVETEQVRIVLVCVLNCVPVRVPLSPSVHIGRSIGHYGVGVDLCHDNVHCIHGLY
jgi:hypothetical protein